jgi:outer membrane immunogenic protein
MLYATGGGAWGRLRIETVNTVPIHCTSGVIAGNGACGATDDRSGWSVGAGGEFVLWQNLTAKIEWIHFDLGRTTFPVDNGLFVNAREYGDMVRGGLNWRFWGWPG